MKPTHFITPADFRAWLTENHAQFTELFVGFHKKDSGKPSITYLEALDQALCFGWIDGVRKAVNATSYMVRFTPRKPKSYWSKVNTKRADELIKLGLMRPPGAKVFAARDQATTKRYSFERETAKLKPADTQQFKSNAKAWAFFQSQPPYYKRVCTWWIVSAKQDTTRQRRLQSLITTSAQHRRLDQFLSKKQVPATRSPR
jgi:uncharacterized protein YdeI (YjbR/CyaY-like superfamily)